MRFRAGMAVGFAVGYYLGARAGRRRYEQLRRAIDALPFGHVVTKTQAIAELAVERMRTHDPRDNVLQFPAAAR